VALAARRLPDVTDQLEDPNQYSVGERHDRNVYDFHCPACGSCGELGVPKAARSLPCPEKCGAVFVQWHPPVRAGSVALRCINTESARAGIDFARAHHRKVNGSP
jgi:hypothetical protein